MSLRLIGSVWDKLHSFARVSYPFECCGMLLAHEADPRLCLEIRPAENIALNRRVAYEISPYDQLEVMRTTKNTKMGISAYYHSHPDAKAEPSALDVERAWPGAIYVIVPVIQGVAGQARAWQFKEDAFVEIRLAVEPGDKKDARRDGAGLG